MRFVSSQRWAVAGLPFRAHTPKRQVPFWAQADERGWSDYFLVSTIGEARCGQGLDRLQPVSSLRFQKEEADAVAEKHRSALQLDFVHKPYVRADGKSQNFTGALTAVSSRHRRCRMPACRCDVGRSSRR